MNRSFKIVVIGIVALSWSELGAAAGAGSAASKVTVLDYLALSAELALLEAKANDSNNSIEFVYETLVSYAQRNKRSKLVESISCHWEIYCKNKEENHSNVTELARLEKEMRAYLRDWLSELKTLQLSNGSPSVSTATTRGELVDEIKEFAAAQQALVDSMVAGGCRNLYSSITGAEIGVPGAGAGSFLHTSAIPVAPRTAYGGSLAGAGVVALGAGSGSAPHASYAAASSASAAAGSKVPLCARCDPYGYSRTFGVKACQFCAEMFRNAEMLRKK